MSYLNIKATGTNNLAVIAYGTGFSVVQLSSEYRTGYRSIGSTYETVAEAVTLMNRLSA